MMQGGFNRRQFMIGTGAGSLALALGGLRPALADGEPFRIGALNPVTGAGSPYGTGMQKAIILAAEEINAAGGAGGRTLQVFAEDTQTAPDQAVLAAKKLIEVNKVQGLFGTWASGVTLAVMPIAAEANIPLLHCSGAPQISTERKKDLVWRFQATNQRFGRAFAEIALQRGYKRPATMAFNNASGIGNTKGFTEAWTATGQKVVAEVVYEPKRPSYRSELQQVLSANPDVIVMGSYLPDTTIILKEWFQSGQKCDWIIPGWAANSDLVAALGNEVTEGLISVDTIANEKAPAYAGFAKRYKAATGQDADANIYAAMTYDMVIAWALAMEAAGPNAGIIDINAKIREVCNPPGAKVNTFAEGKEALKKGKINYEGASSRLDFDQFGDVTPDFALSVIKGGKLVRESIIRI